MKVAHVMDLCLPYLSTVNNSLEYESLRCELVDGASLKLRV